MFKGKFAQDKMTHQRLRADSKKSVQQGRSRFCARSVHLVREPGKMARTPLAAFFNRPIYTIGWQEMVSEKTKVDAQRQIQFFWERRLFRN